MGVYTLRSDGKYYTTNRFGEEVEAIPDPVWPKFPRVRLGCPECVLRFKKFDAYRGHYALRHRLGL